MPQERNNTNIKNFKKANMKPKKANAHFYKKQFQISGRKVKGSNDAIDTIAKQSESCSVSRHKKRRLCSGQGSGTKDVIQRGSGRFACSPSEADMEMNDDNNTLKERLSPFVASECPFGTPEFEEYWVPVHLSSMQIKQYCSILVSNSEAFSSASKRSSLHNVIAQIQKCCDHPYLADPTLRNSPKEVSLSDDPLDAEINISGKLQVLDKLLREIKECGLRALVLFKSALNSERISTGHFLDDLVHQRFGENSYVYISGKILTNSAPAKKKELLELFNNVESDRFICLSDYQACHSSIRLSRVDVVILFNSDRNPSDDIKSLKKLTIDSYHERSNVFRLYSAFTIEENALILSKQGSKVNGKLSSSVCHQLLGWGAPYLFNKLQSSTGSGPQSFINDLVHELSSLLRNTTAKTGPTNTSIISNAHMQNGAYSGSISLYGETETLMEESSSIEFLIANSPSDFWSNLVKQSQHTPKSPCSGLSRRVRKSTSKRIEDENPSSKKSKVKSKKKVLDKVGRKQARRPFRVRQSENTTEGCAHRGEMQRELLSSNPRTSEGQQSQGDQPQPHTTNLTPLETEIEKIQKEREQITKSYQEKKSMLLVECEKEIFEIQKKYDAQLHDSETSLTNEMKILDDYQKRVDANKRLAEILARNWRGMLNLKKPKLNPKIPKLNLNKPKLNPKRPKRNYKKAQKGTTAFEVHQISASALVRPNNPCLTIGSTTYSPAHSLSGLRAPAPHLRSNLPMLASFHNRPSAGESSLEPLSTLSTSQTV